jgi:hypothetical protein
MGPVQTQNGSLLDARVESTVIARFGAVPTRSIRELRTPELVELVQVLHARTEIIGRRKRSPQSFMLRGGSINVIIAIAS